MSQFDSFVSMLEREETTVIIEETGDNRHFKAIYQFPGDEREYEVCFFDSKPVMLSWDTDNGRVRLNSAGEPI